MAFTERINLIIDVASGNAKSAFTKLKTDLKATDGALNKAKVGASALGDTLKANMAQASVVAGTALVTFGVKAVNAFQDVALGAGELRDSLGITAEEASRLQEVAGDLGIGVEAVETAIGRMNRTAATTPEAFDAIGVSIRRNEDGTINTTETFIAAADAISKIPDAAERAKAAQAIFGRGWQQISQLIMEGGDGIRDSLASVEDAKIMGDDQIGQARDFRDALDQLKGSGEALALQVGSELVPALTDAAEAASAVVGALQDVKAAYEGIVDLPFAKQIYENVAPWKQLGTRVDQVKSALGATKPEIEAITDLSGQMAEGMGEASEATDGFAEGVAAVADAIRDAVASATNVQELIDVIQGAADAAAENAERQDRNAESIRSVRDAANDARQEVRDLTAAIIDSAGGAHDAEKAQLAIRDAVDSWRQAQQDANDTVDDSNTVIDEHTAAVDDARAAELGAADAILEGAKAYADEAGAAEGSRKSAELQVAALKAAQDQYPELRDEIQGYIDRLDEVPTEKETEAKIEKDKAEGNVRDWKESLGEIPLAKTTIQYYEKQLAAGNVDAIIAKFGTIPREITTYHNVISNVQSIIDRIRQIPGVGGASAGTSSLEGTSSSVGGPDVPGASDRVKKLLAEARALAALAAATEDAEKRADLLERAQRKTEAAADAHASATGREENALRREVDALREHAEALRRQAEAAIDAGNRRADALRDQARAAREAAADEADGLRERADSVQDAVEAEFALRDARQAAGDAQGASRDAHAALREANRQQTRNGVTSFVHSAAEREAAARAAQDADEEAAQAALRAAEAKVALARERAEARGKTLTPQQETKILRDALRESGLSESQRALLKNLDIAEMLRLQREARREEVRGRKEAERLRERAREEVQAGREQAAALREAAKEAGQSARAQEQVANQLARFADRLPNVLERIIALAARDKLSERDVRRMIRQALDGVS